MLVQLDVYVVTYDTNNCNDVGGVYIGGDGSESDAEFAECIIDDIHSHFEWRTEDAIKDAKALGLSDEPDDWTDAQLIEFWWDIDYHGDNYSNA